MIRTSYIFGLLIALLMVAVGCQDDAPDPEPALVEVLRQLRSPTTIRNDLATGYLPTQCTRLTRYPA